MQAVLGVGCTESGVWAFSSTQEATGKPFEGFAIEDRVQFVPISFTAQLSDVTVGDIGAGLPYARAIYVPFEDNTVEHCSASPLSGRAWQPRAESGYLCVYEGDLTQNAVPFTAGGAFQGPFMVPDFAQEGGSKATQRSGTLLMMEVPTAGNAFGQGSWAVTG
jgi:hypothetical protein